MMADQEIDAAFISTLDALSNASESTGAMGTRAQV